MSNIRSKIPLDEYEHQHEYGMSFADLMSTLVGTFLILLMFFMYQNTSQTQKIITIHEQQISNLKESEKKVERLIGVRESLVTELKDIFDKSNLNVSIDHETGAIRLSDKVLFEYDSDRISLKGKQYLNQFFPKYISTLFSEKTKNNISEIIIEGHTDDRGNYLYNLDLSQRRALSVSKYILSDEMSYFNGKDSIRKYLTSTGKSFSIPVLKAGKIDQDSSRRVEFKFRLKEEETMRQIQNLFKDK